ncbi:hypothetical protein [Shinella sp.]|uniref:hypothetical protein n=1 Tax=Shinella sp. TaxID=1870904 RepID=UPI003D2A3AF5
MKLILKSAVMWTVFLLLVAIWGQTLVLSYIVHGSFTPIAMAGASLALGYILYFAEGLELAVADLRDKDASQITDPRTRAVLAEIQHSEGDFFSQRQIFVVSIITLVTMMLDYDALYVWPFGWITSDWARALFGVSFVTLTVLWFGQVAPKRLAILNSERFLQQSLFIFPLVKLVGTLGLVAPVEQIVARAAKWFGYDERRRLGLSLDKTFNQNFCRYGVATDSLTVSAVIKVDGSVAVTRRLVVVYGHGNVEQFGGTVHSGFGGTSHLASVAVKPVFLGTMPVGEGLNEAYPALDRLATAEATALSAAPDNLLTADQPIIVEPTVFVDDADPTAAVWSLRVATGLPEGVAPADRKTGTVAVMVCDVEATYEPGAFRATGQDAYVERFDLPTRRYSLSVTAGEGSVTTPVIRTTAVGLGQMSSPFPSEERRVAFDFCLDLAEPGKPIMYPAQGAIYRTAVEFLSVRNHASDVGGAATSHRPQPLHAAE